MNKIFDKAITKNNIEDVLKTFKDLGLSEHYNFEEKVTSSIDDVVKAKKLLEGTHPLTFSFSDNNTLYYTVGDETEPIVFDEDVSKSFSRSDQWLYDKLVSVSSIFPNASTAEISAEQTGFYVCLVIASVFQDEFIVEFKEVADKFDFKNWRPQEDDGLSFSDTCTDWIQLGSKSIKMVAAAGKYALVRERVKKQAPSALQLPEEQVLKLNETINSVSQIRWEYDNIKLSPDVRKKLSKLEIKVIIKERDDAINLRLKSDQRIYQIWRLMNLNSNLIPPTIVLKFNRKCRVKALELFKLYSDGTDVPKTVEEKLIAKKIENKLKKELRRAYLNKMLALEVERFSENPDGYIAPDFV